MAAGSFKMTVDNQKKTFYIYAEGVFTQEVGMAYTNEFIEKCKSIDTSSYTLLIDVIHLNTSSPDVAKALSEVMKLYFKFPFDKRYMTNISNLVCMMQVKKLGSSIPNFESMQFVDTVDNLK